MQQPFGLNVYYSKKQERMLLQIIVSCIKKGNDVSEINIMKYYKLPKLCHASTTSMVIINTCSVVNTIVNKELFLVTPGKYKKNSKVNPPGKKATKMQTSKQATG